MSAIKPRVFRSRQPDDEDALPEIGRRIRARRKLQRRSLLDLANDAGCSESLLSRIENGPVMPSLSTLHRISQALRVNVAVLEQRQPGWI